MTDISDYLMKEASKADAEADRLLEEVEQAKEDIDDYVMGWKADQLRHDVAHMTERASFHRGQASGFRQATFVVMQHIGTPTHD